MALWAWFDLGDHLGSGKSKKKVKGGVNIQPGALPTAYSP